MANASAAVVDPVFGDQSRFKAAYDRRLEEIKAVPDDQLLPINLDVQSAVAVVLAAISRLEELQPRVAKLGEEIDQSLIASLEDYAQALSVANVLYEIATSPPQDIAGLNEEAMHLREVLKADAAALAVRGVIDEARLQPFTGAVGYKNVATELMEWAYLFREHWTKINGRTALTATELAHAVDLGERLLVAAGKRELDPRTLAESARIRQQAFTLLVKAYTELRRVVGFLRFYEGDAEQITPSLYGGRGTHPRAEPAPANAATKPVTAAAPAASATAAAVQSAAAVPVGYPGSSPFLASK